MTLSASSLHFPVPSRLPLVREVKLDPGGPLLWGRASIPLGCSSDAARWGFLDTTAIVSNVPPRATWDKEGNEA